MLSPPVFQKNFCGPPTSLIAPNMSAPTAPAPSLCWLQLLLLFTFASLTPAPRTRPFTRPNGRVPGAGAPSEYRQRSPQPVFTNNARPFAVFAPTQKPPPQPRQQSASPRQPLSGRTPNPSPRQSYSPPPQGGGLAGARVMPAPHLHVSPQPIQPSSAETAVLQEPQFLFPPML